MRRNQRAMHHAREYLAIHDRLSFSVLTVYEVLRGLKSREATSQLAQFNEVFAGSEIFDVTPAIAEVAATIHAGLEKQGRLIGHADILIAATALVEGCQLATNNIRHFDRIDGLVIANWLV